MSKVYQLIYLDENMGGYYHIASSLDKTRLEAMVERVKNADTEYQRIQNELNNKDDYYEESDRFYDSVICDNTFPLNQIDDYDWEGYDYENQSFAEYLNIIEYDLI